MEERHAPVEGVTREVPQPFFVLATQNPFGSSGTQKLPESQLDRFMICLTMGYPDPQNAIAILKGDSSIDLNSIQQVIDTQGLLQIQKIVHDLHVDESLYEYVVALTEATRNPEYFALGLSPRGSIALMKMARAYAWFAGRDFVLPEDIHDIFHSVAGHRVRLNAQSKAGGLTVDELLDNVLKQVSIPRIN